MRDKDEVSRRLDSLLQRFPDFKNRLRLDAGKINGGEKQQLPFARALMLQPKVLLLDEPSVGLSPNRVIKTFESVMEIDQKFKTTMLVVEQKVHEILRIAHRVYALRVGEMVFQGTPGQLQEGDALKKIFLV